MKIRVIKKIEVDDKHITRIDADGIPMDIRMVTRGEAPSAGENYLVIRVYEKEADIVPEKELFARTKIVSTDYGYDTKLEFCGQVTEVSDPDGIVDPYFHDLQIGKIVTVHTPHFDFDVDGLDGIIPKVGDYISGTGDIMGILIKESQVQKNDFSDGYPYIGSYVSPCTKITERFLLDEALCFPEKFLSGVFQGKETYVSHIFNNGAKLIGHGSFSESDFHTKVFMVNKGEAICAVIKLPGAESEFDYSVIALKVLKNVSDSQFYVLEKGEENTYLLRRYDKTGQSYTVDIASMENDSKTFDYVCEYLGSGFGDGD